MSQHVQQHDGLHLCQTSYAELVQAPVAGMGVDALGRTGALLVDLLGFRCRHALPPHSATLGVSSARGVCASRSGSFEACTGAYTIVPACSTFSMSSFFAKPPSTSISLGFSS